MFNQNALVKETGRLNRFALHLTKNKSDADDLLQSTYLRALEKASRFEEGTNLFGWTSKIMFNLFVTTYRRRARFETQFDPESYLENRAVEATQDLEAELAKVKRTMKLLSPGHRDILDMICMKGMQYEEVSAHLNIPIGTVRSRLSRARRQMNALLGTDTAGPEPECKENCDNGTCPRAKRWRKAQANQVETCQLEEIPS